MFSFSYSNSALCANSNRLIGQLHCCIDGQHCTLVIFILDNTRCAVVNTLCIEETCGSETYRFRTPVDVLCELEGVNADVEDSTAALVLYAVPQD